RAKVAETRYHLMLEYVRYMGENLAGTKLAKEPQMRPLQRAFMSKAMDFSKQLCLTLKFQPNEQYEIGIVQFRMAEIQERLGDIAQAEAGYPAVVETLRKAIAEHRAKRGPMLDPNIRLLIAVCHLNLANMCPDATRLASAEKDVGKALAEFHEQVKNWLQGCPLWPYQRANLCSVYGSYGSLLFALGQIKEAEQFLRLGLDVGERLVQERPRYFEQVESYAWAFLAEVRRELGSLLQFTGRASEAEPLLRQAI